MVELLKHVFELLALIAMAFMDRLFLVLQFTAVVVVQEAFAFLMQRGQIFLFQLTILAK